MDETTFWQMIERAKADSGGDGEEQVRLLVERLAQLEISAIAEFDFLFRKYQSAAYRCDVWEAAIIATGGLGDDGFTDFRAWLIAQGHDVYEQVLSDPDWLAHVINIEEDDFWGKHAHIRLESMNYVPHYAYDEKTEDDSPFPYIPFEYPELDGEWCTEDEKPHKYPQLWAVFGSNWE
jgi:hypothetical protein